MRLYRSNSEPTGRGKLFNFERLRAHKKLSIQFDVERESPDYLASNCTTVTSYGIEPQEE